MRISDWSSDVCSSDLTNILQIENEYYSNIRPKRTTGRCERPAQALAERGVQYIEVRCLDIDPESPIGISDSTCRFMDAFLLFFAAAQSSLFPNNGFCTTIHDKIGRESCSDRVSTYVYNAVVAGTCNKKHKQQTSPAR